jgi:hypothetical protein
MRSKNENATYAQMGVAALLPGMQFMIDRMQAELDTMRTLLTGLQEDGGSVKRGRPAKSRVNHMGWPADPEERKAEMRRRMKVRAAKKATHPRDPNHPEHEQWVAKMSAATKKRWGKLSVRAKKERLARMQAGRKHNAPIVKLEVAS